MIIGSDGPAVILSARTCAFLERYANLARLRVWARGVDPTVAAELTAVRKVASQYRSPVSVPVHAGPVSPEWVSTAEVADRAYCTDRAVRRACQIGDLPAVMVRKRWQIAREDADDYVRRHTRR